MNTGPPVKIFVASGSELISERKETVQVVRALGKVFPSLNLEAVEWETDLAFGSYEQRIQDQINALLEPCDVVLVLFYSKTGAFTLEEYRLAMEKNKKVFLYFKSGFSPRNKIEYDNYGKVLEFRDEIERENRLLFKDYDSLDAFKDILYKNLSLYLSQTYIYGGGEGEEPLPARLYRGSKKYYDALRGSNGRFRYLRISDIILPGSGGDWLETCAELEEKSQDLFEKKSRHPQKLLDNKKFYRGPVGGFSKEPPCNNLTILEVLPRLWSRDIKHAVIVGDGGMGKTVSLIHWWEKLLEKGEHPQGIPVPVFIALNEFNQVPMGERKDFIMSSVLQNYVGDEGVPLRPAEVKNNMKTPLTKGGESIPSIVLLLDGFNEITVEKQGLLLELNHLVEQCPGLQVVITSRYDMRGNFNWGHWNLVKLKELEKEKVEEYLQGKGLSLPGPGRLRGLLGNPMMLTLYTASCEVQENQKESRFCCFKDTVDTPGELLWNFIEAQVAKLPERVGPGEGQVVYYWFLLKYVLPGLGFEMEKQRLFDFSNEQFLEGLDRLCLRFAQRDFFTANPHLGKYVKLLPVGESGSDLDRIERAARVRDIFCSELHMLVEEGQSLRFLHQDFRDFFAAVHLLNEADIGLSKGEIPGVLKERLLDYFVRRLVGEIEGEHRCKPYLVKGEGWKIDINKESRLYRALELCRCKFSNQKQLSKVFGSTEPFSQRGFCPPEAKIGMGFAVCNIVTIWKELRGELSGADLSGLDLSGVMLNGVCCSRFYHGGYLAACFEGARVGERNLFFGGHSSVVTGAVYSRDGKKILSASDDNTIKEWDTETGTCMKTLAGHSDRVTSAVYSRDGKKILSASYDNTIKEWDAETGACMKTLAGHSDRVAGTVYSLDGKKILSASWDKTIKEWDMETGACVQTLTRHFSAVSSAVYSPDGKKILSASYDHTIKEWDTETGACVQTLAGHSSGVTFAVYSRDGEKILSASYDHTIKEWDTETGVLVKTLVGHLDSVSRAVYNPDGEKILSASEDHTINEWDAATGACVQTLAGHYRGVTGAVYSPDGKKILSASYDNTIKEWGAATGACMQTLAGHSGIVTSALVSPDGKKILSASRDHTIKEWDAATGACVQTLAGHSDGVNSAVYSPDGEKILSASWDKTIKEWYPAIGTCVQTLTGHSEGVNSVVYSPDGKKILSASYDHTIKEWDSRTGACVKTLAGHTNNVNSVLYSRNGKKILSTSDDQTIREWDVVTGQCLKIHKQKDNPKIPGYPSNKKNRKLRIEGNKIYVQDATGKGKALEIINIPGLFIQGCSFQNLEKGSQCSEDGRRILKMYNVQI